MSERGPFEPFDGGQRDRNARYILIGMGIIGIVLIVLVLPPISLLSGGSDDTAPGGGTSSVVNGPSTRLPGGLEALSQVFNLQKPNDTSGPYAITLNLSQPVSDGRNLGLYTNVDGRWERVAAATLVNNGTAAMGEVADIPANLAVLRRTTSAARLVGSLPHGAQIDPDALDLLTSISPADYSPVESGTLVGSATVLPETEGTIVPSVSALTPAAAEAVNTILASPGLREAHMNELVQLALLPGNAGINIDYRLVDSARKLDFSAFVAVLAGRLNEVNRSLSLTLPAPIKAGVSWDTGAYDWEGLALQADTLRLIAAPDPSTYYSRMEEVLSFLESKLDMRKLLLIVGRSSYEKANDGISELTLLEGLTTASEIEVRTISEITPNTNVVIVGKNIFTDDSASGLRWDDDAFAVSFSYPGRGGQRTVWLENSLSLAFRLDLARRHGLGGVVVDDVSLEPEAADVWEPLRSYVETGTVRLVQPNGVLLRPVWQLQAGRNEPNTKGNLIWQAPTQPGFYDISLIVSDGVIRAAQKIILEVKPGATSSP